MYMYDKSKKIRLNLVTLIIKNEMNSFSIDAECSWVLMLHITFNIRISIKVVQSAHLVPITNNVQILLKCILILLQCLQ